MKRFLALTLAMLFISVGAASATEFTLTGSYFARGTWVDNWDGTGNDSVNKKNQYGVYDHEMSLDATWQISPATKVFSRFEIRDEDWGVATSPTESSYGNGTADAPDDNIAVEHVYGQHTFADGKFTIRTGLMGTTDWGTDFGNDSIDAYRVMLIQHTKIGPFIWFVEKHQGTEPLLGGAITTHFERLEEDNDADVYHLGWITKVKDIYLKPAVIYADVEFQDHSLLRFNLSVDGTIGNVGFEGEFLYNDYNYDISALDYSTYGAYANAWIQLNALKIGGLIAYGSYDEDVNKGFEFGDDFTAGGAMILGDELFMWDNGSLIPGLPPGALAGELSYDDLQAVTLLAAYASYAATEKLTLSAYLGYADSNVDLTGNEMDGASAWEVNVQAAYKLSSNVTYSAGAAMAQLEYGSAGGVDPDEAVEIYHKLSFDF